MWSSPSAQDAETLLNCMVHALEFFKGVPQTVLTDNMKTVVLDRVDDRPCFHPKMLDFCELLRLCSPRLSSLSTGDQGQDRVHDPLHQGQLLVPRCCWMKLNFILQPPRRW